MQNATLDVSKAHKHHFSRTGRLKWNEGRDLPHFGLLRLTYVEHKPRKQTVVHYSLDLAEPAQREVAIQLWQRATIEPGENWQVDALNEYGQRGEVGT